MKKLACFFFVSLLLFTSCGDYRGASAPYSYAPETSESVWIPPKAFRKEPVNFDHLDPYELKEKSLSLAEVIDIALFNNPTTKQSWAEARQAAAQYGQSLQNYFVLSNLTADYMNYQEALFTQGNLSNSATSLENISDNGVSNGKNTFHGITYGTQLNLSYTILDFGLTKATSKAALEALYAADFTHNHTLQQSVHDVMNDYYAYLSQQAAVKAAEEDVYNAQTSLDAVMDKLYHGVADIGDKVQATTKLLEQKLKLVSAQKDLTTDYTILLNTMGLPANAYLSFEHYPEKIQLYDILDLDNLLKLAIKNRPDLLALESTVRSKQEELKKAKAERYPIIAADFEVGRESANLGIGSYYDYDLTFSFTFPLFQGYFIQNGIKKATAAIDATQAKLKELQLSVFKDVTTYFNNASYAKESYKYAKQFLDAAKLDFKVNLEQYKAGTSTIVEVINAQASVANAHAQLIQAEKDWYTSIANLAYATGLLTNKPELDVELQETNNVLTPCSNPCSS